MTPITREKASEEIDLMVPCEVMEAHGLLDGCGVPGEGSLLSRIALLVAENARLNARLEVECKRTDRDRLLLQLDEDRTLALRMLADLSAEEGREGEARGWGYLASAKKWPTRDNKGWLWYRADGVYESACCLISTLHDAVAADMTPGLLKYFPSASLALLAVVGVIASGAWTVDAAKEE